MELLARDSLRIVHVEDDKGPLFDELIHNLDDQIALSNIERFEEESRMHDIKAEFAYMSESTAEMAVI